MLTSTRLNQGHTWIGMPDSGATVRLVPLPPAQAQVVFPGTSGDDILIGTVADDEFFLDNGGDDTAIGSDGFDTFYMGGALTVADHIDGGGQNDTVNFLSDMLVLDGDYSAQLAFAPTTMTGVSWLALTEGNDYSLKLDDANVQNSGGDDAFFVQAWIGEDDSLTFDGSSETDGAFFVWSTGGDDTIVTGNGDDLIRAAGGTNIINGGAGIDRVSHSDLDVGITVDLSISGQQEIAADVFYTYISIEDTSGTNLVDTLVGNNAANFMRAHDGNDTLTGGKGDDLLVGEFGADTMKGGQGDDHFSYGVIVEFEDQLPVDESATAAGFDTIIGFNFREDHFEFPNYVGGDNYSPTGIDSSFKAGGLSVATFEIDLASAVGASRLGAHHAVLYTAKSGGFAHQTFLVVDQNGVAGYQSGDDMIIRLQDAEHANSIDVSDFIGIDIIL